MLKPAPRNPRKFSAYALLPALLLGQAVWLTPDASAIQPQRFEHTTEADFEPGEVDGALITSLGDVKLATESTKVSELPEVASIIYDLHQMPDGTVYLAVGPQGMVLKQHGVTVETVVELEDEQVFALGEYNGQLLVAVSGATSRLAVLEEDGLTTLAELEDTRYIWDVASSGDAVLAATGTEGKLLSITPGSDEPATVLYDAQQKNILSLAVDSDGSVIIGTDEDGLVLRVETDDQGETRAYALYDAGEPEVGAILIGAGGEVYIGTADAEQARPGRMEEAVSEEAGRPDDEADEDGDEDVDGEVAEAAEATDVAVGEEADSAAEAVADEAEASTLPDAPTAEADGPEAEAAEPTEEQYDRLRELIRDRLQAARKAGELQTGPMAAGGGSSSGSSSRARPVSAPAVEKEGNAVYRIDNQGFVQELFRDSVMILKLVEVDGKLLAATGNEGQVFVIDPVTRENAVLVDFDSEQVPALMINNDGHTVLGTANPAELLSLGSDYGHLGTYTSAALDAAQISLWGTLAVTADIPEGSSLTVETRSGNVQDPEQAAWSAWSQAQVLMPDADLPALAPKEIKVQSPPARFLQYRLTLTGANDRTPVVDRVEAAYVTPNLKPVINTVTAAYPEQENPGDPTAPPVTLMNIEWEAADDNQDALVYKLEYQPAGSDYQMLIEEDLTEMAYEWETRRVPDGRYTVRVTADDRTNNPGDMAMTATRLAAPVLIDNSAPEVTAAQSVSGDTVTVSGSASDAWSAIGSVGYALDNADEFIPVLPEDLIYDSTKESWVVTISDLSPGPHVLTLRATDTRGNAVYQSVLFEIK